MDGKFKVTRSVETGYHYGWSIMLSARTRVVLFGQYGKEDRGGWRLTPYDLTTGKELPGAHDLKETERPHGMAEVVLDGKSCVALCYWRRKKIDFHDLDDLGSVVYSHEVAPHRPLLMCTLAPSVLLYINQNSRPREVHWLDCSISPPKPLMGANVTHKQNENIGPLCCVEKDEKEILIIPDVNGNESPSLNAYVRKNNGIQWSLEGEMPGMDKNMIPASVVSDDSDNFFILDRSNDCVHMMSVDGIYFGVIVRGLVQGIGEIKEICWSQKTSSLIVAHLKSGSWVLTNVKFGDIIEEDEVDANVEEKVKDENENVTDEKAEEKTKENEKSANPEEKKDKDEDNENDKDNESKEEGKKTVEEETRISESGKEDKEMKTGEKIKLDSEDKTIKNKETDVKVEKLKEIKNENINENKKEKYQEENQAKNLEENNNEINKEKHSVKLENVGPEEDTPHESNC